MKLRAILFLAWLFGASVVFETYPPEQGEE